MSTLRATCWTAALLLLSRPVFCRAADAPGVGVIPQPSQMEIREGRSRITPATVLTADPAFGDVGRYLAEMLAPVVGAGRRVAASSAGQTPERFIALRKIDAEKELGPEGYRLEACDGRIVIEAHAPAGAFYACQTLRQLLPTDLDSPKPAADADWSIPNVRIVDRPRFGWRGMMLDSARHFQSKEVVKRYLDLLALHKMNRLHWHLIDDQGWRVEIKRYPKLTEVGAWRPNRSAFLNRLPNANDERYGGFHTQDDIREIVAYAAARHITIVPEIELPGHCLAMLASYPEISCTGGPFPLGKEWIYKDVCCAGNERTFEFLDGVLTELTELFPSPWIHTGGDECPKDRWKACPRCQARIRSEGLRNEAELQSYFIRRTAKIVESKGRRLLGWDEILEGGLAPNAVVQSWRGMNGGIAAIRQGHDVVMSPTSHCYLDYTHQVTSVQKSYGFEPIPPGVPNAAKHLLGIEGCLWLGNVSHQHLLRTGTVLQAAGIDAQAFPRLSALAEVGWSPKERRDWPSFKTRLIRHGERLERLGVNFTRDVTVWGKKP